MRRVFSRPDPDLGGREACVNEKSLSHALPALSLCKKKVMMYMVGTRSRCLLTSIVACWCCVSAILLHRPLDVTYRSLTDLVP